MNIASELSKKHLEAWKALKVSVKQNHFAMGFHATVLLVNGAISLVFASVALVGSTIMIIAVVRNPLNVITKPLHSIEDTGLVLSFLVGTVLLPYFGVTEILQGVKNKSDSLDFPSVVLLFTDFFDRLQVSTPIGHQHWKASGVRAPAISPSKSYQSSNFFYLSFVCHIFLPVFVFVFLRNRWKDILHRLSPRVLHLFVVLVRFGELVNLPKTQEQGKQHQDSTSWTKPVAPSTRKSWFWKSQKRIGC